MGVGETKAVQYSARGWGEGMGGGSGGSKGRAVLSTLTKRGMNMAEGRGTKAVPCSAR